MILCQGRSGLLRQTPVPLKAKLVDLTAATWTRLQCLKNNLFKHTRSSQWLKNTLIFFFLSLSRGTYLVRTNSSSGGNVLRMLSGPLWKWEIASHLYHHFQTLESLQPLRHQGPLSCQWDTNQRLSKKKKRYRCWLEKTPSRKKTGKSFMIWGIVFPSQASQPIDYFGLWFFLFWENTMNV